MGQDVYPWGLGKQGNRQRSLWALLSWGGLLCASGKGPFGAPVNGQEKEGEEADTTSLAPAPGSGH